MDKSLVTFFVWPLNLDLEIKKKSDHIHGPFMKDF